MADGEVGSWGRSCGEEAGGKGLGDHAEEVLQGKQEDGRVQLHPEGLMQLALEPQRTMWHIHRTERELNAQLVCQMCCIG